MKGEEQSMSRFNDVLNKKAVALTYDEAHNAAPIVVASGMGYMAEKIVEIANENGVPVYEDNSLATVLTQLELGSEIPAELFQAIVDIYVYFLNYVPKKKKVENLEGIEEVPQEIEQAEVSQEEKLKNNDGDMESMVVEENKMVLETELTK